MSDINTIDANGAVQDLIPLFKPGDSATPFSAARINQLVRFLNALKRMQGQNGINVTISDANVIIELAQSALSAPLMGGNIGAYQVITAGQHNLACVDSNGNSVTVQYPWAPDGLLPGSGVAGCPTGVIVHPNYLNTTMIQTGTVILAAASNAGFPGLLNANTLYDLNIAGRRYKYNWKICDNGTPKYILLDMPPSLTQFSNTNDSGYDSSYTGPM